MVKRHFVLLLLRAPNRPKNREANEMRRKILTVVGTRPNFIKITQFEKEFAKHPDQFDYKLLHTGQHFDKAMSDIFFEQLGLNKIDFALGIESGSPAHQIGKIISGMDEVFSKWKPDLMLVVGDVNSTLAASLAANKSGVQLAHVESGLRSRDASMPEEHNRIVTDYFSDILFTTENSGNENLQKEGKQKEQIHFVGNTMIDTLVAFEEKISQSKILDELKLNPKEFILMTIHRPSNVDSPEQLKKLYDLIDFVSEKYAVVFPIHPRTLKNAAASGMEKRISANRKLIATGPMDYFSFQQLVKNCALVLTDSGGIQEETTFRRVSCLTLRENTERPVTVEMGTNELIPFNLEIIAGKISSIQNGTYKTGIIPPLWDGKSSQRIVETLCKING